MTGFIVRRILSSILVVILTSMFVFVLFFKGLGTAPARNYCEKLGPGKCTPTKLASIEQHRIVTGNHGSILALRRGD